VEAVGADEVLPGVGVEAVGARKRPREATAAHPSKTKLKHMPWVQLSAHLRDNAVRAGAVHLALTLRVVAERAYTAKIQTAAVAAGVLPALAAAMRPPSATAAVQEWACRALANLTAGTDAQCDARKLASLEARVLPQIVATTGAPSATAAVQEAACWALANITFGVDAQGDARKQAAANADALPQIVAAMRAHSAVAAVQEQACCALDNITAGTDAQRDARA